MQIKITRGKCEHSDLDCEMVVGARWTAEEHGQIFFKLTGRIWQQK